MAEVACFPGTDVPVTAYLDFRTPDLAAHYWIVAGSPDGQHREDIRETATRVYSSAAAAYVPVTDPAYVAWLAAGNAATAIDTEEHLSAVLASVGRRMTGPVRQAYGDDLITALSDAELSAMGGGTLRDQRMLGAQRVPFRATDEVIVRLAAAMKIDPAEWLARVKA